MGAPEQIETTDLEDTFQTFVPGVQSMESMEFTCNYNPTDYAAVLASATSTADIFYHLEFGENGADGIFAWSGKHSVRVTGAEVNAVREMVITVIPSSAITKVTT